MKRILIIFFYFFVFCFTTLYTKDMKKTGRILTLKDMKKIKGGGQWVGYKCHTVHSKPCGEVSDPCIPITGEGLPCTRCSGMNVMNWCVQGACSDICIWEIINCDSVIDGKCNLGTCEGWIVPGSTCSEYDCG
ncbi:MAG: hypothetical protein ACPLZ9_00450 [Candidatus Ratteibacteria bacterium]